MKSLKRFATWLGLGVLSISSSPVDAEAIDLLMRQIEHRNLSFTVVSIPLNQYRIDLIAEPNAQKVVKRYNPILMMNAGMFHANHEPVGLEIIDGTVLNPINTDDGQGNFFLKPNGVFAIGKEGAVIQATGDFNVSNSWRIATQSGPLLLQGGAYHPKIKPDSPNFHIRNGVCTAHGVLHFIISDEPVRFYDLASLMKERLGCQDGLYLDGAVSKLYQQTEQGWIPKLSRKPLGSWLVVFPKSGE